MLFLKHWIAVIIVAAIIIAGLLLFQRPQQLPFEQETGFDSGLAKLNRINTKVSLQELPLNTQSSALLRLSASDLFLLKSELESFREKSANEAAGELAGVYIGLVGLSILLKQNTSLSATIEGGAEFCSNLKTFGQVQANLEKVVAEEKELETSVNSFISKYPAEAKKVSLSPYKGSGITEKESKNISEAIGVFEGECAA